MSTYSVRGPLDVLAGAPPSPGPCRTVGLCVAWTAQQAVAGSNFRVGSVVDHMARNHVPWMLPDRFC